MCVIFVSEKTRCTPAMVEQGYDANNAGAGAAWQELSEQEVPIVRWAKGLSRDEAKDLAENLPLPYVLHFRIPSCGGPYKNLCHPFPISENVDLRLAGDTDGSVLFHNGHWGTWKDHVMREARDRRIHIPAGKWTDTRGMAWMAYLYGAPVLELIDEKTVVFSPEDIEIFGTGWTKINDVWCSNTHWQSRGGYAGWEGHNASGFTECRKSDCNRARYGTTLYCWNHQYLDPLTDEGKKYLARQEEEKNEDKVRAAKRIVTPGGAAATAEATFRHGPTTIQDGSTEPKAVQEGSSSLGKSDDDANKGVTEEASQMKLLGPAEQVREGVLCLEGDTQEDWATFRRWVRRLNDSSVVAPQNDAADRQHRKREKVAGFIRVGPL